MLRLIEDGNAGSSFRELLQQIGIETIDQLFARRGIDVANAKVRHERLKHLHTTHERVKDQRYAIPVRIQLLEKIATQGRLARTGRAGDEHESFFLGNPIEQRFFGRAILIRLKDKPWVWSKRERLFRQAKEFFIHRSTR